MELQPYNDVDLQQPLEHAHESTVEGMAIVDGNDVNMEPLEEDDSSLTDHRILLEEAHTLSPNTPNHRWYLKYIVIVIIILVIAVAVLGIASDSGCFSSNTGMTSTTLYSTGVETEFMKNDKDPKPIKSDEHAFRAALNPSNVLGDDIDAGRLFQYLIILGKKDCP
ncbi:unnamed protein product [Mytilus coruscus]|uniref:Uncharacterized protein n=1 Tax=Mytilus coruscus TaxID=42192 RepID=A0A6J8D8B5_MYTCO|nr:unnamed protein product [Mytilus coruscus]